MRQWIKITQSNLSLKYEKLVRDEVLAKKKEEEKAENKQNQEEES